MPVVRHFSAIVERRERLGAVREMDVEGVGHGTQYNNYTTTARKDSDFMKTNRGC